MLWTWQFQPSGRIEIWPHTFMSDSVAFEVSFYANISVVLRFCKLQFVTSHISLNPKLSISLVLFRSLPVDTELVGSRCSGRPGLSFRISIGGKGNKIPLESAAFKYPFWRWSWSLLQHRCLGAQRSQSEQQGLVSCLRRMGNFGAFFDLNFSL